MVNDPIGCAVPRLCLARGLVSWLCNSNTYQRNEFIASVSKSAQVLAYAKLHRPELQYVGLLYVRWRREGGRAGGRREGEGGRKGRREGGREEEVETSGLC